MKRNIKYGEDLSTRMIKLREQLEYLDRLEDVLCDCDDGGLYTDLNMDEEKDFQYFLNFLSDLEIKVEKELRKLENKKIEKNLDK